MFLDETVNSRFNTAIAHMLKPVMYGLVQDLTLTSNYAHLEHGLKTCVHHYEILPPHGASKISKLQLGMNLHSISQLQKTRQKDHSRTRRVMKPLLVY